MKRPARAVLSVRGRLALGGALLAAAFALSTGASQGAPATAPPAKSGSPAPAGAKKKEPIHITSDRMEAYNQQNLVVFMGNVKAIQGEFQIQSDRLEVYIKKREKPGDDDGIVGPPAPAARPPAANRGARPGAGANGQEQAGSVERLVAIGHVLVNQTKTKFASGERLDYTEETGIAILTGNPRAWEGSNQVIGEKIEMFLKEDRTIVHGSTNRRVNVTLHPDEEGPPGSPSTRRPQPKGTDAYPRR